MAENAQEQLLGYLLDALEDDERQQVQQELATDPQLRQQLETMRELLQPLEPSRVSVEPPPGLARRTCRYVVAKATGRDARPSPSHRLHAMRPDAQLAGGSSRFSWLDMVAVASILVAAALLIFPALHNSRVQARTAGCAENLRNLSECLTLYGEAHDGELPSAPPEDRLGVGGGFAVILAEAGLLQDPRLLLCPDSPMAEQREFNVPSIEYVAQMPDGPQLRTLQTSFGGSYSMSLGSEEDGRYHPLSNDRDDNFALISDVPDAAWPDFRSHSHAGGRNVLFCGGNVRYMAVPVAMVGDDHLFLNAAGHIGPGLNSHDSVIPPAGPIPIVHVSNR